MSHMMTTAVNTMNQLQKQFDLISHNISNSDTTGYKTQNASFAELMVQSINNQSGQEKEIGRVSPFGIRQGVGARVTKMPISLEQGSLKTTDRPLDIAFTSPKQFLKVSDDNALRFTRNGALYLMPLENQQGTQLVNQDGLPILDENNNRIILPNEISNIQINDHGQLTAEGLPAPIHLGVIEVKKPQLLEQKGDSLLGLPDDPNVEPGEIYTDLTNAAGLRGDIGMQQQTLENANVDIGVELSNMTMVQRALQFQSRSISISDQMMGIINNIR
ncbi:flagellar hook-basal body complex protein FlhP [Bacillus sp. J14TS2]|uniref:flagellar hook-basal body protein n=1 Tax=Bacillus sp. J14TS2 TaxID=2807188 RepID=UPI001B113F7A|nr:flagellar hook-basal body protein [Bacillus sp. J14TS2]GIN69730.1 flagellar hook-basal body complex protein FlhP [Bacillus sp. J14TS2]